MHALKRYARRLRRWWTGRPAGELFPGFEVTAADTVVDFGCGPGHSCVVAGEVGAAVIAVDVDPAIVEHVRQATQGTRIRSFQGVVSGTLPVPLPDGVASVVLAQEVLEHVDDPRGYLAELVRIGRPGARYILSVPDPASEALMRAVAPPSYFQKPGHINIFAHKELDALVRDAGLEVERRVPFGFYWSMWWVLRWTTGKHYAPRSFAPRPAILRHWDRIWSILQASDAGKDAIAALDRALPKSQVLIARKLSRQRRPATSARQKAVLAAKPRPR
jgi:SAM-dependent methyltransferase